MSTRWGAFGKHSEAMNSRLTMSLRIKVNNQCSTPMVYQAQTWGRAEQIERKLRSAQ